MSKFRELLTIENTRPYLRRILMDERDQDHNWTDVTGGPIRDALKAHIRSMRDSGDMAPIFGTAGHRIHFVDKWSLIRSGDRPEMYPEDYPERLVDIVQHVITTTSAGPMQDLLVQGLLDPKETEEDALEFLVSTLESGNFRVFDASSTRCDVDDKVYAIDFEGWKPAAATLYNGDPIEPITPDVGLAAVHLEVEFPSGNLIISDTFEVEEFVQRVSIDHDTENMSDFGRIDRSRRLASEGIVHVFNHLGPKVMSMENGGLNFVEFDDPDDVRNTLLDRPDSGLWAISVIDRETFVTMVQEGRTCTREAAEAVVEEATDGLIQRDVAPGTYHLYFGTNDKVRLDEYDIEGIDQDGISDIMVLSPEPLALTPKSDSRIAEALGAEGPKM